MGIRECCKKCGKTMGFMGLFAHDEHSFTEEFFCPACNLILEVSYFSKSNEIKKTWVFELKKMGGFPKP